MHTLKSLFGFVIAATIVALAACSTLTGPSLAQIQSAGNSFVATLKTDVALFEAQTTVSPTTQSKITIALDTLSAANVVLQGLTTSQSTASYIQVAQSVIAAGVSVVNALPAGTIPQSTLQEIDAAAFAFQLAAGLAQQAITAAQTPAPVTSTIIVPTLGIESNSSTTAPLVAY